MSTEQFCSVEAAVVMAEEAPHAGDAVERQGLASCRRVERPSFVRITIIEEGLNVVPIAPAAGAGLRRVGLGKCLPTGRQRAAAYGEQQSRWSSRR